MSAPFLEIALAKAGIDPDAAAADLRAWLPDEGERADLAAAILKSVSPECAEATAEAALVDLRQSPPLGRLCDEARAWVGAASPAQIAVFAWHCFDAMPEDRQMAFLQRVCDEDGGTL